MTRNFGVSSNLIYPSGVSANHNVTLLISQCQVTKSHKFQPAGAEAPSFPPTSPVEKKQFLC